jgi:hypothetical protein
MERKPEAGNLKPEANWEILCAPEVLVVRFNSTKRAEVPTNNLAGRFANRVARKLFVPALLALLCETAAAQSVEQRGYLELSFKGYPQTAPGDSGRAIGESLLRYEPSFALGSALTLHAGFDVRSDTHRQVERDFNISYWDRSVRRPALQVRRLSLSYFRGP